MKILVILVISTVTFVVAASESTESQSVDFAVVSMRKRESAESQSGLATSVHGAADTESVIRLHHTAADIAQLQIAADGRVKNYQKVHSTRDLQADLVETVQKKKTNSKGEESDTSPDSSSDSDSDISVDSSEDDSEKRAIASGDELRRRRRRRRRRREDRRRAKQVMSCEGPPCISQCQETEEERYFCYIGGEDDQDADGNLPWRYCDCQGDHQSCKGVVIDGVSYAPINKDSALNIIFVPYDYGDLTTFVDHVKIMTEEMQKYKPLNVIEIGTLDYFYVEEHMEKSDLCYYYGAQIQCHGDQRGYGYINDRVSHYCGDGITKAVIVVQNPDTLPRDGSGPDINSGTAQADKRAGIVVGGGKKSGEVAAHELGHILFGFGDQYDDKDALRSSCAFNCMSDKEKCDEEAGGPGQCEEACSGSDSWAQKNNIMLNHDEGFGRLLERASCCKWYYQQMENPKYCVTVGLNGEEEDMYDYCEEEVKSDVVVCKELYSSHIWSMPTGTRRRRGISLAEGWKKEEHNSYEAVHVDSPPGEAAERPSENVTMPSLLSQHVTHRFDQNETGRKKRRRKGVKHVGKGAKKMLGKGARTVGTAAKEFGSGVAHAGETVGRGMVTAVGGIGKALGIKNKLNKRYGLRSMKKGLSAKETKERNAARASDMIGESYEMFDKPDACLIKFNEYPLSPTCKYVDGEEKKLLTKDGLYSDRESKGDLRKPLCKCDEPDSLCLRNVTLEVHNASTGELYRTVTFFNKLESELAGKYKGQDEDHCISIDSARLVMHKGDVVKLTHYGHSNARKVIVDCGPKRSLR